MLSRLRVAALALLAVTAVVAGAVTLALGNGGGGVGGGNGGGDTAGSVAGAPTSFPTPTDVTAGAPTPAGVTLEVGRLEQDGIARTYLVVRPTELDRSVPLIVGLHGRNATPGDEARRDGLVPYVAAGRAVLVYPVGYQQAWNVGDGCCGYAVAEDLDDVAFVGQVVDAVRGRFGLSGPTDLVGYSNGGRLAFTLACRDVTRYDAVVAIAATPPDLTCPQAGVPVPVFVGLFDGDDELPTHEEPQPVPTLLPALTTSLLERDACLGEPTVAPAGRVTVRVWTACTQGTVVQTAVWQGSGHHWPEDKYIGRPDGADLVWSFLAGVHARADAADAAGSDAGG